jgi:transcriptional regulator with XRE-family HTH domain
VDRPSWVLSVPEDLWGRAPVVVALDNRDVAALLALIRQYTGHSQNDLACATGIAQGRISEYMRRVRQPTLDTIERIAYGLGMPAEARGRLGLAASARPPR